MKSSYNAIFEEAFSIISTHKLKASSLRLTLLNTVNIDNNINLKIRQYLGEFEYDLQILFDILNNLKSSIENINKLKDNSEDLDEDENQMALVPRNEFNNLKKCNSFRTLDKYKNTTFNNNIDDYESKNNSLNHSVNKTKKYCLTINICNDPNLKYSQKKGYNKKVNRSNSCKSWKGFENSIKFDILNDENQNRNNIHNTARSKTTKYRNYIDKPNFNDFISEKKNNNKIQLRNNNSNLKSKNYKNITDYSSHKINDLYNNIFDNDDNNESISNNNNLYKNNNLYNENLYNNNLYNNNYNNIDDINRNNNINATPNDDYKGNNNKAFPFEEVNNYQNSMKNLISANELKENFKKNYNNNNYNLYDNNYKDNNKENYNINNYDNYKNDSYHDLTERNRYRPNMIYSRNYNEMSNQKNNLSYSIGENKNYNNYLKEKYKLNNSQKIYYDDNPEKKNRILFSGINNGISNNVDDILENDNKDEIIKTTINLVLQDSNKLNELKKYLGDDIGEKLLRGNVNDEEINNIVDILKNYQSNLKFKSDKNLFRGSRRKYKNLMLKKFNQQNEMLFRESLNNKGYTPREHPLELFGKKDYFNSERNNYSFKNF